MNLQDLLQQVAAGTLDPTDAADQLIAAQSLPDALVDHARAARCGAPEVIFAQGKTASQVTTIAEALLAKNDTVLATRCTPEQLAALSDAFPDTPLHTTLDPDPPTTEPDPSLPTSVLLGKLPTPNPDLPPIPIVTAGTSDTPVALEAQLTAAYLHQPTVRITDIGVAGIHRITPHLDTLRKARVVIVIAGMEGALPSVLAGLLPNTLIGVPTSVGYGTAFHGVTPLLAMLNACASGVLAVNIDAGFSAAFAAARINTPHPPLTSQPTS
ncbi:MAG: nickel pincer cofactor biosynthesis protein LarB [Planctomycetota bacterium]